MSRMNISIYSTLFSRRIIAVAVAALVAGGAAMAAQTATGELKHSDKAFIEKAAKAGQEEVQISQVALERATNPQIRDFAQTIVNDHQQMNSELATLASSKGVALPTKEVKVDKWQSKKATEFDKDYVKEMAGEHDDAVSLFEKAAKSDDPEIAAFAQKYLPKLQAHKTAAESFKKMY